MMKINLLNAFPGDDPTCKRIPLTQGQAALVSAEDYDRLSQRKWSAKWLPNTNSFYAARGKSTQYMHREILRLQPGEPVEVDHGNHRTLDNRRSNLEVVTTRENQSRRRRKQSKYGVGVYANRKGFVARAMIRGCQHHLGTYDTPEKAKEARAEFLARFELAESVG